MTCRLTQARIMPVLAPRGLHSRCPRRRPAGCRWRCEWKQSPSCRLQHTHPPLPSPPLTWQAPWILKLSVGLPVRAGKEPVCRCWRNPFAYPVEPELRAWQMGETSAIMKGIPSRWPEAELRGCGIGGVILPIHPLLGAKRPEEPQTCHSRCPELSWPAKPDRPELGVGVRGTWMRQEGGRGAGKRRETRSPGRGLQKHPFLPPTSADLSTCPPRRGRWADHVGVTRVQPHLSLQGPGAVSWKLLSHVEAHPASPSLSLPPQWHRETLQLVSAKIKQTAPHPWFLFPKPQTPVLSLRFLLKNDSLSDLNKCILVLSNNTHDTVGLMCCLYIVFPNIH